MQYENPITEIHDSLFDRPSQHAYSNRCIYRNRKPMKRPHHKPPDKLKRSYQILSGSLKAWLRHRSASKGAALAFYTLFSMAPILMLSISLAGYFFGADAAQGKIIIQLQNLIGLSGAQTIQSLLTTASAPTSGLMTPVAGSVLLLLATTSVFVELKDSLDELWGIERPHHHSALKLMLLTRLLSFGLVMVLAALLFVSLLLSAALVILEHYVDRIWINSLITLTVINHLISFAIITSLFAVINKVLPDAQLSWRDAWFGAIFTAIMFTLGKHGIGLYLANSKVASSFGSAGSLIALLLWIYYSAQIFFLGAEFTRQYAHGFGSLQHKRLNDLIKRN
jgi:membrane protein